MRLGRAICVICFANLIFPGVLLATAPEGPCSDLPFFSFFEMAGIARREGASLILSLTADLHSADCGVPDCYGTKILLKLDLRPENGACLLEKAEASTLDFFEPGCADFASAAKAASYSYVVEPKPADVSSRSFSKLVLRDRAARGALVLLPRDFFFFEKVHGLAILRTWLDPGEVADECCWGASSSRLRFLRTSQP